MIHKEPTMSTEHKTDVKDVLDKFDSQGKSSSVESLQQLFNNSPQDQMLFEGLANADQHLLDLSIHLASTSSNGPSKLEPHGSDASMDQGKVMARFHSTSPFPFENILGFGDN